MNRSQLPISGDSSHDQMLFELVTPGERDAWMRAFPNPLPEPYRYQVDWIDDGRHGTIRVQVVLKDGVAPLPQPPKPAPNIANKHAAPGSPADIESRKIGALRARV